MTGEKSMVPDPTDDPFVTRLFGRYMTVDTDKLLKSEAARAKSKLAKAKAKAQLHAKTLKKHFIPQPLLEPQSPSLPDEIEVDISLPNTNRNDHVTTLGPIANAKRNGSGAGRNDDGSGGSGRPSNGANTDTDDGISDAEFDMMSYYSNEDILTTKELIDDMAKIMAHGAEFRRNQMNHKSKFMRKSHGACFTGADR